MKSEGLTEIFVVTTLEAEEAVAFLLESLFGVSPSIYTNVETSDSFVTAYLRASPAEIRSRKKELETGLQRITGFGLDIGAGLFQIRKVRREDWSESWKKYFKTIKLGKSLLIQPSWIKEKPAKGQAVVVLDPGLSFGTGQHATTAFCLRQIVAHRKIGKVGSMLDIGCGSGILAISAAQLGYNPVEAFDFDPMAVSVARQNCILNKVQDKLSLSRKDLTKLPLRPGREFDLVCANLLADLLIPQRQRIVNRVVPGGVLVLAGILAREFAQVRAAFESVGLELIKTKVEREWQSGAFRKLE
jgi:ribosomal protein L11 methyltransferase